MNSLIRGEPIRLPYDDQKLSVRAANVAANITGIRWRAFKEDGQWYIESTNQLVLRSNGHMKRATLEDKATSFETRVAPQVEKQFKLARKIDTLQEELDALKAQNLAAFEEEYGKVKKAVTITFTDGSKHKMRRKQGGRADVIVDKLKRALGQGKWNKVSTRVLDEKKLEAAVAAGDIDLALVKDCSIDVEYKAYIEVSK